MEMNEIQEFIKKIELFKDLTENELVLFAELFEKIEVQHAQNIFTENSPATEFYIVFEGKVELLKRISATEKRRISNFTKYDFFGEISLVSETVHSTSAKSISDVVLLKLNRDNFVNLFDIDGKVGYKILSKISTLISRRMRQANYKVLNVSTQYESGNTRKEKDSLGDKKVPIDFYFGIYTSRSAEIFNLSGLNISYYHHFIDAIASFKIAAAKTNEELGLIENEVANAIVQVGMEIRNGKLHNQFVTDMYQGGSGILTMMNANEVFANRTLEILEHKKGEYKYCDPIEHVNLSQSLYDSYSASAKIGLYNNNRKLVIAVNDLVSSFKEKISDFDEVIKIGRVNMQDASPMTMGQTFELFASSLEVELMRLNTSVFSFLEIKLGGKSIDFSLNSDSDFSKKLVKHLKEVCDIDIKLSSNSYEDNQDIWEYIQYSSSIKRLAIKLSKICNDIRLMASGPRTGINELKLPNILPSLNNKLGKNDTSVIDMVTQISFKVIANDQAITMASEAGDLEFNAMEPLIVQCLYESVELLRNAVLIMRTYCISGIQANKEGCKSELLNSISLISLMRNKLDEKICNSLVDDALKNNKSIYNLILENNYLTEEEIEELLTPTNIKNAQKSTIIKK